MANFRNLKSRFVSAILMIPGMFGLVATVISRNPEALYRILQSRGVLNQLSAQHSFLKEIAERDNVMEIVVGFVPSGNRMNIIQLLSNANPSALSRVVRMQKYRSNIVEVVAEDLSMIKQIIETAGALAAHGSTPAERLGLLHRMISDRPAFVLALAHDEKLQNAYIEVLERSLEISGKSLASVVKVRGEKVT
jgi:hypothetical protein